MCIAHPGGLWMRSGTIDRLPVHAPPPDRVRANTWPDVNERLDRTAQLRLRADAVSRSGERVTERLDTLDREWDFDRVLETEAATMGLVGLALALVDRRFLVLPAVVSTMLLVESIYGWYPLLPLFRRMGVRTREEIDRERYALKALRGDFDAVPSAGTPAADRAAAAWKAVCS